MADSFKVNYVPWEGIVNIRARSVADFQEILWKGQIMLIWTILWAG